MVKRLVVIFVSLLFLLNPIRSFAYGINSTSYESANDRYRVVLDMTPYTVSYIKAKITKGSTVVSEDTHNKTASTMTMYVECNGTITITWYDGSGSSLGSESFSATQIVNENASCNPSGGDDPPGGGDDPPDDGGGDLDPCDGYLSHLYPQCPDYDPPDEGGEDPPPGGGDPPDDGGTDPPPDGGGTEPPPSGGVECPVCDLFECPNWDDYMGKIDEIIDGFPSIEDAIRRQTRDIEDAIEEQTDRIEYDIVGQPPSLPSEPSMPSPPNTYGFENEAPVMEENPDLDNSGFTLQDLEDEAPEIEFREDPTGGFDIADPVGSLPAPPSTWPIPGETDAGEWEHNPTDEVVTPEPPQPDVEEVGPPAPGDSGGVIAPVPESNIEGPDASMNYKTHPDNPDGV